MSVFLYYLPGKSVASIEDIESVGIKDIFYKDTPRINSKVLANGPDGGTGLIIALDAPGRPQVGFFKSRQSWRKTGDYWIGYDKEKPPSPTGLHRPIAEMIDGYIVNLKGFDWIVPLARVFPEGTALPQGIVLGPNGKASKQPLEKYADFCRRAEMLWNQFNRDGEFKDDLKNNDSLDFNGLWSMAVEALEYNYFMGKPEVSAYMLIETGNLSLVLQNIIDVPGWAKVQKAQMEAQSKKEPAFTPDGSNSSGGGGEN